MIKHIAVCDAPLCNDSNDEAVWLPGEKVCLKTPMQKYQRVQRDINELVKEGRFKNLDTPYTRKDLETRSI
jgi:hypothetical protein